MKNYVQLNFYTHSGRYMGTEVFELTDDKKMINEDEYHIVYDRVHDYFPNLIDEVAGYLNASNDVDNLTVVNLGNGNGTVTIKHLSFVSRKDALLFYELDESE